MKVTMGVKNANVVRTELRHTGERVVDSARGAMRRAAQRIRDEARINAPRDRWNLEEAIEIVRDLGARGRLQLTVDIQPMIHGVDVQQYALIIHEHYEEIISEADDPNRRQGTKEKQAQYPGHLIGGKYLERAAEKEQGKLTRYLVSAVTRAIEGSN